MKICRKCGDYIYSPCRCREFEIIDEDGEEYTVFAVDEEGAALKYAKQSNVDCDHYLVGEAVDITVNGTTYRIGAEPDIHYTALKM